MVRQHYPKQAFVISAVLAIFIFLMGTLLGWSLDKYRESEALQDIQINELNTQSYFLEKDFIKGSENICGVLESRIDNFRFLLTKIGSQLPSSEEKSLLQSEISLDYLKRKYFIAEVQFLMLLRDLKDNCGSDYIPIIFFYTKDDQDSRNQGYVLTWANEKYNDNLIILSFDKDYDDEPLVNTLKLHYGVAGDSTIILNEKVKKDGFVSKEELDGIISGLLE